MVVKNRKQASYSTVATAPDDENDPRCVLLQNWSDSDIELVRSSAGI